MSERENWSVFDWVAVWHPTRRQLEDGRCDEIVGTGQVLAGDASEASGMAFCELDEAQRKCRRQIEILVRSYPASDPAHAVCR